MRTENRNIFYFFQLFCLMKEDIIIVICKYIYTNWIVTVQSQREFATIHEIEESTVRRIKILHWVLQKQIIICH